jgi:prepilin-type N-terminal cleavage/methylation domain-containing protein
MLKVKGQNMRNRSLVSGFTILEVLTAVAIIGILAAIAVTAYEHYAVRARGTDVITKYDALRVGVHARAQQKLQPDCAALVATWDRVNLVDAYTRLEYGFQAVPGGYRPVLAVCSQVERHGTLGVKVARGVHQTMLSNGVVEKDAVLTDSVVSFAMRLTEGDAPICQKANTPAAQVCGGVSSPSAGSTGSPNIVPPPEPELSRLAARPRLNCDKNSAGTIDSDVIQFGKELTGYVMNNGNLATGGALRALTVEVALLGGQQVGATDWHGATLLSYASAERNNELMLWNPDALIITLHDHDLKTNINVNDGKAHRISVSWDGATGNVALYDNGVPAWSGNYGQGAAMGGFGKLVLGQDQDSFGGGFHSNDAFQGQIFSAAFANKAITAEQMQAGPLGSVLERDKSLITDILVSGNVIKDATQRNTYTMGGAATVVRRQVDSKLILMTRCGTP